MRWTAFMFLRMGQHPPPARANHQTALQTGYQRKRLKEKVTLITNGYRQRDDGLFFWSRYFNGWDSGDVRLLPIGFSFSENVMWKWGCVYLIHRYTIMPDMFLISQVMCRLMGCDYNKSMKGKNGYFPLTQLDTWRGTIFILLGI